MYATKEKRWDKIDHTSFVLGITCIRDKEVMVPGKAHILCIRDNMYYGAVGIGPLDAAGPVAAI